MKLYLVQHGEAVSKEVDPDRPLSEQGRQDINRLALLVKEDARPGRLLHSGKARARQTAEILARILGVDDISEQTGLTPNADVETFLGDLDTFDSDLMVVSHQPFLGKVVSSLVLGEACTPIVEFLPGSLVCLVPGDSGRFRLKTVIQPEILR